MQDVRILVVEDEEFIKEALIGYLELKGYENTFSATKGGEAIEKIAREKPDFVLLDIKLADEVDGLQVLESARETSPESKIIMMSAYSTEYVQKAKKLGAHSFMKKPIQKESLENLLQELC